jgi:putative methionine-R-sulfoxide reductase with GAF domain
MPAFERDYDPVHLALNSVAGDRHQRMRSAADALWRFFKDHGVSWIGFYLKNADSDEMTLGPSRDKPACSPIGLHGACGMSWAKKRPILVADVANLGANYIACDPRDRSELVLPLFDEQGRCYGVLDADSHDRDAFGESDVREMKRLMESTAISWPSPWLEPLRY